MRQQFKALQACKGLAALFIACGHFLGFTGKFTVAYILMCDFFFICSGMTTGMSIRCYESKEQTYIEHMFVSKIKKVWIPYIIICTIWLAIIYIRKSSEEINLIYIFLVIMLLQCMGFMSDGQEILNASPIGISWYLSVDFWGGDNLFLYHIFAEKKKRYSHADRNCGCLIMWKYFNKYISKLYGCPLCKTYGGKFNTDICADKSIVGI